MKLTSREPIEGLQLIAGVGLTVVGGEWAERHDGYFC